MVDSPQASSRQVSNHIPAAERRWVIMGAQGMLGTDFLEALQGRNVLALDVNEVDIRSEESVSKHLKTGDVVVNCAAYTAVDAAEENEPLAFSINAQGPAVLAQVTSRVGATLAHISTDYVFDGMSPEPYAEYDFTDPQSAYGRTKVAGEWAIRAINPEHSLIFRTAWLYGRHGNNFISTMLKLMQERDTLDVVNDQFGQPTWTVDLAKQIIQTLDTGVTNGIFHATSSGQTSWFEFAQEIFSLSGQAPERVKPTDSSSFVRPAKRPANSVLSHQEWERVGMSPIRDWRDALHEYLSTNH